MKKLVTVLFFGICFLNLSAQIMEREDPNDLSNMGNNQESESSSEVKIEGKTSYKDYKLFSYLNDTTYIDTTLTLKKDAKMNYIRKDVFELLPFHNMGQTYNKLGYDFSDTSIFPAMGFNAKQYNYQTIEDIKYYSVATPTSEMMYRSALGQGQLLETLITMNTSEQFNFSLGYKGLRSLGDYRNALASHGNFKGTFNYFNKKETYFVKGHISTYDFYNEENGGLTEGSVGYFEANDSNYSDRGRLDTNLSDTNTMFEGKRYYVNQTFTIFSKKNEIHRKYYPVAPKKMKDSIPEKPLKGRPKPDSISTPKNAPIKEIAKNNLDSLNNTVLNTLKVEKTIKKDSLLSNNVLVKLDSLGKFIIEDYTQYDLKLGHTFTYETTHYRFVQDDAYDVFGTPFGSTIYDHTSFQKMNNEVYVQLNSPISGQLRAKANYYKYNYHYNGILYYDDATIDSKLKGNAFAFGGDWNTTYGKFNLTADASSIIAGDITGHTLKASTKFALDSIFSFRGFAEITSKTPDFNKLLYQSSYKDYNWQNNFKNEEIKNIGAEVIVDKWGSLKATYTVTDNYTYFNETAKPTQAGGVLNYFKVKANQYVTFGKFTVDNTIMYQNVIEGAEFFRVPEIVTQNTIYFTDYLFPKKPLYLQTGVTFKYFTAFKSNAYNPLLSEFTLQNNVEIGNYPILDFFVNAQIQRTRLFFKVENFTAPVTGRNYYSAPNYPYRDLTIRFGVVWNFFI
ncbi:MAG: putative porin [Lutibacter sp.]|nr:putative porin [Lutibacter sp.]